MTGVCSTRNLELVRSIGADHVIDYTREDFTRNGETYDLILAAAGYRSIFDYRQALTSNGTYVMFGGAMAQVFQAMLLGPWLTKAGGRRMVNLASKPSPTDLAFIKQLVESGKVVPVIDRCYPLEQLGDALRHYEQRHSQGKVVITVQEDRI